MLLHVFLAASTNRHMYGATNECRKLLSNNTSFEAIADALENLKETKE
jgi:hypothetical protein